MKAKKNKAGLYVFPLTASFRGNERSFTGLVDTGSNICATDYKIPTTLRATPTLFKNFKIPLTDRQVPTFIYSLEFRFDGRSTMTSVYRLPIDPAMEVDFILGMPVLSLCKVTLEEDGMDISWLPDSSK